MKPTELIDGNRYHHTRLNVDVTVRISQDVKIEDGTPVWDFRYFDGRQWRTEAANPDELVEIAQRTTE
jgi:hypothetical protein